MFVVSDVTDAWGVEDDVKEKGLVVSCNLIFVAECERTHNLLKERGETVKERNVDDKNFVHLRLTL